MCVPSCSKNLPNRQLCIFVRNMAISFIEKIISNIHTIAKRDQIVTISIDITISLPHEQ